MIAHRIFGESHGSALLDPATDAPASRAAAHISDSVNPLAEKDTPLINNYRNLQDRDARLRNR
jgi:hypothetical protein